MFSQDVNGMEFSDVLPVEKGSHNSAKMSVPVVDDSDTGLFDKKTFRDRLEATVTACRELGRTSLWVEVPMSRAGLIEDMAEFGLRFHHADGEIAVLNVWLKDTDSKIPEFATHNVGVGAVVVNSRDEILCVRELRKNYMPWKTPTGLSELGEQIDEAAVREVLEETGIPTKFHSIVSFRQSHGLMHGRSDMFFVCRLDPIEETDENGNLIIPAPIPQENEIEKAEWVPLAEYRAMVKGGEDGSGGHPMMSHVIDVLDDGRKIERRIVHSIVPGRKPNAIYYPSAMDKTP
jgi:ADP-ribose pyrophosphatase YjhB (NUDIX family)